MASPNNSIFTMVISAIYFPPRSATRLISRSNATFDRVRWCLPMPHRCLLSAGICSFNDGQTKVVVRTTRLWHYSNEGSLILASEPRRVKQKFLWLPTSGQTGQMPMAHAVTSVVVGMRPQGLDVTRAIRPAKPRLRAQGQRCHPCGGTSPYRKMRLRPPLFAWYSATSALRISSLCSVASSGKVAIPR